MEKTTFTSGSYAFEAFSEDGVLYSSQRITEYIPLKISNIVSNVQKTVKLNHPALSCDLIFKQIRINKTVISGLTLTIDIYRGTDFIDRISLNDNNLPFPFYDGSVLDTLGKEYNQFNPIELRVNSNKDIDSLYIKCLCKINYLFLKRHKSIL